MYPSHKNLTNVHGKLKTRTFGEQSGRRGDFLRFSVVVTLEVTEVFAVLNTGHHIPRAWTAVYLLTTSYR